MSKEETEGYPKRGTTLEGRVAQLFRIMGHKVSRNVVLEDHEIDVYVETKDGKKTIRNSFKNLNAFIYCINRYHGLVSPIKVSSRAQYLYTCG